MSAGGTDKLRQRLGSAVWRLSGTLKWIDLEIGLRVAIAIEHAKPLLAHLTANRRRNRYVALSLLAGLIVWSAVTVLKGLPDHEAVRGLANGTPGTTLLDVNGRELGKIVRERRVEVPLAQVSPHVVRAVLAVEDQRFLEHGGLDVVRIAGAFLKNLRVGRVAEGGSPTPQIALDVRADR